MKSTSAASRLVFSFCLLSQMVMADVSYTGSSTIGLQIMPEAAPAFEKETGIRFQSVEIPGSGKGIQAVINGKAVMAGASRPLTVEEKSHKLYYQIIGYDAIGVFVNKKNPVKKLTKDQVKNIFTGRTKNWKELGGDDSPVVCITETLSEKHATAVEFQSIAMDGADYRSDIVQVENPAKQVERLKSEENGIISVSFSFNDPAMKAVYVNNVAPDPGNVRSGSYILSRPLLLVTKGLPKGDIKRFINFMLSPKGQEIVAKRFVPIVSK